MTARISTFLDDVTIEAVTAYARLHRITFDQAVRVLISIGLDVSTARRGDIATAATR